MQRGSRARHDPMTRRRRTTVAALAALVIASASGCAGDSGDTPSGEITVAAASDLRPAFEEIGAAFTAQTGTTVVFSFGSSGRLKEQIVNGAPFDLYASADPDYVDQVIDAGRGDAATRAEFAWGALALWTPPGVKPAESLAALGDPDYRRIALANPEHAPYGVAATQALDSAGLPGAVTERLVYGESVADAFRIAQSGNADVGIVAKSLAVAHGGTYAAVPAQAHEPVRHVLVVTATGERDAALDFAQFLADDAAEDTLAAYGFTAPPPGQGGR